MAGMTRRFGPGLLMSPSLRERPLEYVPPIPVDEAPEITEEDLMLEEIGASPGEAARYKSALKKNGIVGAVGTALAWALASRDGQGPEGAVAFLGGFMEGTNRASQQAQDRADRQAEAMFRRRMQEAQLRLQGDAAILPSLPPGQAQDQAINRISQTSGGPGVQVDTLQAHRAEQNRLAEIEIFKRREKFGFDLFKSNDLQDRMSGAEVLAATYTDKDPMLAKMFRDATVALRTEEGQKSALMKSLGQAASNGNPALARQQLQQIATDYSEILGDDFFSVSRNVQDELFDRTAPIRDTADTMPAALKEATSLARHLAGGRQPTQQEIDAMFYRTKFQSKLEDLDRDSRRRFAKSVGDDFDIFAEQIQESVDQQIAGTMYNPSLPDSVQARTPMTRSEMWTVYLRRNPELARVLPQSYADFLRQELGQSDSDTRGRYGLRVPGGQ